MTGLRDRLTAELSALEAQVGTCEHALHAAPIGCPYCQRDKQLIALLSDALTAESRGRAAGLREAAGCDGNCSCEIWTRHDAAMALYKVTAIVQAARAWADAHKDHAKDAEMRQVEAALLRALATEADQ